MPTRAERLITYCMGVADEFQSRVSRMQVFVKHNLSSGTANEIILREFLAKHAPGEIGVEQGFICDLFVDEYRAEDRVSRQCDILIYDQINYPIVYSDGPIKVVLPESVKMVIEVKTNFKPGDIKTGIENLVSAKQFNKRLPVVIFAFQSPRLDTVIRNLQRYKDSTNAPTAILLLDKGIIIHNWYWPRSYETEASAYHAPQYMYVVQRGKQPTERGTVVLTFLLLLFFIAVEARGLIPSDPMNTLVTMMEEHTDVVQDPIYIGEPLVE
jgi:hypothetical protein